MFKGIVNAGTVLSNNTNIPFLPVLNTNKNTVYDSTQDTVQIREAGYYDIKASIPLTNASGTPLIVRAFANGEPISEAGSTNSITATTGTMTFTVLDTIRVLPSPGQYANVSIRLLEGTADLADDGVFIIERRK